MVKDIAAASNLNSDSRPREAARRDEVPHFGCPYILEVGRVLIMDVQFHAQDFLTASHVSADYASVIAIPVIYLDRKDLTRCTANKINTS